MLGLAWLVAASCGFGGEESAARIWPELLGRESVPGIEQGTAPRIVIVPGPLRGVVPGIEGKAAPRVWINPESRKEAYIEPQCRDLLLRVHPSRMLQNPWNKEALPEPWVQDLLLRRIVPGAPAVLVPSGELSDLVVDEKLK